jgi:dihydroneopterin aldolase
MKYNLAHGIIRISGMSFTGYHGVMSEEQKLGNRYLVDIEVKANIHKAASNDDLEGTVDYGALYTIAAEIMQEKHRLLEHVAFKIGTKALDQLDRIDEIRIRIRKHNPPVGGLCEESSAEIQLSRF